MTNFSTPHTPGTEKARQFLFNKMMKQDGAEMELLFERPDRSGKTFSADVLEDMYDNILAWVASRNRREWESTDRAPYKMTMKLSVEVES